MQRSLVGTGRFGKLARAPCTDGGEACVALVGNSEQRVGGLVRRLHLQPRARADAVVGQGQRDAVRVRVVRALVAGAVAQLLAHLWAVRRVRRQAVGGRPVLRVVAGRLRRVVAREQLAVAPLEPGPEGGLPACLRPGGARGDQADGGESAAGESLQPTHRAHPGETRANRRPNPRFFAARLPASWWSTCSRSGRGCYFTRPLSPWTSAGPAATASMRAWRSSSGAMPFLYGRPDPQHRQAGLRLRECATGRVPH
jgi:hypothetical protein